MTPAKETYVTGVFQETLSISETLILRSSTTATLAFTGFLVKLGQSGRPIWAVPIGDGESRVEAIIENRGAAITPAAARLP